MEAKKRARKEFHSFRDSLPKKYLAHASKQIAARLFKTKEFSKARAVGIYVSKGSEVDTKPVLHQCVKFNKMCAVPKVKGAALKFFLIESLKDLEEGEYGILEPKEHCEKIDHEKIGLFLVPGIAFDRRGHRLGYGMGYYDRFLRKNRSASIGLCYGRNFVKALPTNPKDVKVKQIITERGIYTQNDRFQN